MKFQASMTKQEKDMALNEFYKGKKKMTQKVILKPTVTQNETL